MVRRSPFVIALVLICALLSPTVARGASKTFSNGTPVFLPAQGAGSNSQIAVSGIKSARKVSVTLHGLTHGSPGNFAAMLASPSGVTVALIANRGGAHDVNDITLTFDDGGQGLPQANDPLVDGAKYLPNGGGFDINATCNTPAEGRMKYVNVKGQLNGTWTLCVYDPYDINTDTGTIGRGWSLKFHDFVRGGGGGGGTDPEPTDWEVTLAVIQAGRAVKHSLAENYESTGTIFDATLRFNKKPRRGEVSTAEAFSIDAITVIDKFDTGGFGDDERWSILSVTGATFTSGAVPIVRFTATVDSSDHGGCSAPTATDVSGKIVLIDADPFDDSDRYQIARFGCDALNRVFEPAEGGILQVQIGDPVEVPEVA